MPVVGPQVSPNSRLVWLQTGVSYNLSSSSINWPEWFTELRETLAFTSLLKNVIKDRDESLDKETHRVRCGKVPNVGTSVPVELGCITFPGMEAFANLEVP